MTCAKQRVVARLHANGELFVGENLCQKPQKKCPREGMETGEGYHLCKDVCGQEHHAEVAACLLAGEKARGSIIEISGHTHCCAHCIYIMRAHGIFAVYFV